MNRTSKLVRQITDAAIIVSLYAVFFVVSRFLGGVLEYDLFFLLPIPIALYAFKYNVKISIIPFVSTSLISIFACITPFSSISYVIPALIIGILFGSVLIKSKLSSLTQVLIISSLCLIMEILAMLVLSSLLGIENIFEEIKEVVSFIESILPKININNIDIPLLEGVMEGIIPSIFIIISLIEGTLIYLVFTIIIFKTKMSNFYGKPRSFSIVIAPIWLSVIYLISIPLFIIGLINFKDQNEFIHILCILFINLFLILTLVYVYFGVKCSLVYCKYKNFKVGIILVYLFVLVPPLQIIVSIIGVYDSFSKTTLRLLSLMTNKE